MAGGPRPTRCYFSQESMTKMYADSLSKAEAAPALSPAI